MDLGYADLFNCVTKELRVSERAAACRIQVAGVCQRFPQILQKLAAGEITLTVAGRISPMLTAENCDFLLEKCRGLSTRDVLSLLVDLNLRREMEHKPSLRKISASSGRIVAPAGKTAAESESCTVRASVGDAPIPVTMKTAAADANANAGDPPAGMGPLMLMQESLAAPAAERYNLKLSISTELKKKIERLGAVIGIDDAVSQIEKIIDKAVDDSLARRDPVCKERRLAKKKKRAFAQSARGVAGMTGDPKEGPTAACANEMVWDRVAAGMAGNPKEGPTAACANEVKAGDVAPSYARYVPAQVRAAALSRAGYRCEFVSEDGRRCEARHGLQIDHVKPVARGGTSEISNVQVLCCGHNLRKAEHDLGEIFMRGVVAEKRRGTEQPRC